MLPRDLGTAVEQQAHQVLRRVEAEDVPPVGERGCLPLDGLRDAGVGAEDDLPRPPKGVLEWMLPFSEPPLDLRVDLHPRASRTAVGSRRIRVSSLESRPTLYRRPIETRSTDPDRSGRPTERSGEHPEVMDVRRERLERSVRRETFRERTDRL